MDEDIKEVNINKDAEKSETADVDTADVKKPTREYRWEEGLRPEDSYVLTRDDERNAEDNADPEQGPDNLQPDADPDGEAADGSEALYHLAPAEEHLGIPENEDGFGRKVLRRLGFWGPFVLGIIVSLAALTAVTRFTDLGGFVTGNQLEYYHDLDDSYGKYYEIVRMIGEDPLAETTPEEITDDALKKLVEDTGDPYAEYFTSKEYEEFSRRYIGDYVGIGIGVVEQDGDIVVKTVMDDGPAAEAGMQPEDVIVAVDGTRPTDIDDAVGRMTGEAGTEVTVTVKRGDETLDLEMKRKKLEQKSVGYSVLEDDKTVGYIRITSFRKDTDDEFKQAVKALEKEGCDKFIIDLRDNGGGLTDVSIEIADYLLPACRIMTEVRKDGTEKVYNSKASSADLTCVVMINENTASASEILTGALKDNHACTVVGTRTYGKGVTQITHRFEDGSAVKLTDSEYYRPNGDKVQGEGIIPDIESDDEHILENSLDALSRDTEQD